MLSENLNYLVKIRVNVPDILFCCTSIENKVKDKIVIKKLNK